MRSSSSAMRIRVMRVRSELVVSGVPLRSGRCGLGTTVAASGIGIDVNVAPCPGVLATVAEPPWARAMASTIDSPMPVPSGRSRWLVAARA